MNVDFNKYDFDLKNETQEILNNLQEKKLISSQKSLPNNYLNLSVKWKNIYKNENKIYLSDETSVKLYDINGEVAEVIDLKKGHYFLDNTINVISNNIFINKNGKYNKIYSGEKIISFLVYDHFFFFYENGELKYVDDNYKKIINTHIKSNKFKVSENRIFYIDKDKEFNNQTVFSKEIYGDIIKKEIFINKDVLDFDLNDKGELFILTSQYIYKGKDLDFQEILPNHSFKRIFLLDDDKLVVGNNYGLVFYSLYNAKDHIDNKQNINLKIRSIENILNDVEGIVCKIYYRKEEDLFLGRVLCRDNSFQVIIEDQSKLLKVMIVVLESLEENGSIKIETDFFDDKISLNTSLSLFKEKKININKENFLKNVIIRFNKDILRFKGGI